MRSTSKLIIFKKMIVITLLASCTSLQLSHAATQNTSSQNKFTNSGIAMEYSGKNLDISIDQAKSLKDGIPLFTKAGAIPSGKFTPKDIINHPVTISSNVVGLMYVIATINNLYTKDSNVDELHINVSLLTPERDGSNIKQPCYSFDFNRLIFDKINWENFDYRNFPKIARNFTYSNWCSTKINEETSRSSSS